MCGIAGCVSWSGRPSDSDRVIERMTAQLVHRGPDGMGVWTDPRAALGHTRLSIIDLRGGSQPMVVRNHSGDGFVITYNGELYNYRKLRSELQALGRDFVTESDTEVVLHAFAEWGTACVNRFTGMFAFAIWDQRRRRLVLARDPLGVKPLFYFRTEHSVIFGSEEKAILAHPEVAAEVDHEGIAELFCMVPMTNRDRSILRGFRQVLPGHVLTFDESGCVTSRYWQLEALPHRDDATTTTAHVRELLQESVQGQLVSDVSLGAMLSGGIDSSAVAAIAATGRMEGSLATFDIDYVSAETNYSSSTLHVERDSPWAHRVSAHIGSVHSTKMVTTEDLLAAQEYTLRMWGRPTHRTANVSLYLLFRHIRDNGVRVVVGGEGADEAFAGYAWWRSGPTGSFPWQHTFRSAAGLLRPEVVDRRGLREYAHDSYATAMAHVPTLDGENPQDRHARRVSWLTYTFYLDYLLTRVDRMSMAASVEARVPFCDRELVQYCWNIPWDMKNRGGIEKGILRDAVGDLLPVDVLRRRKSGYPMAQTGDYQRASYAAARDMIADPNAPVWEIVDPAAMADLLNRTDGNVADWTALNHVTYVLDTNAWMTMLGMRVV
ncbi:asparagine synthase (glutamine-hydrolyzing) [Nocardia brevicatena]|uniref:asparagine synthase (glutamine-hydrolyzing) n=1 Tax=Nocardia brevicatena TaxID=37327 RepID=UPI0002DE9982|nr:asparagine synthase (glutamine-hydrolyzing) [Nocardia brevicatena]